MNVHEVLDYLLKSVLSRNDILNIAFDRGQGVVING